MRACSHCGQTLPDVHVLGLRASPMQLRILRAVHRAGPHGIDRDDLVATVYKDDPNGGPDDAVRSVQVTLSYLNKKLKLMRKRIRGEHGGGASHSVYRLEDLPR